MKKSDLPLVSIPVFTYNGEKFLEKQLDSILAQTYENIEIILCDDGSTDGTIEIINKYKSKYNLKCHFNSSNLGVHRSIALILPLCNGDFIATADQDDIWKPEKIKTLVENISDNVLIYSPSIPINENDELIHDFNSQPMNFINGSNNKAFFFDNCVSGHALMFKKEIIKHIVPLPDVVFPDWWIAFVASSFGTIHFYEEPLVYYRRHNTQMTKKHKKEKIKLYKKIFAKEENKKNGVRRRINILTAFASLTILNEETKLLLKSMILEFEKFPSSFYNKKLAYLLHQHENEIFTMAKNTDYSTDIKNLARGIWYYRLKLYT